MARFAEVRVMDVDREEIGVMSIEAARAKAEEAEVDLVLIQPDARPPVVRIVEYSKYKYEIEKSKKKARAKQRENR